MSQYDFQELLDRYLKGDATASEKIIVEDWLDQINNSDSAWQSMDASSRQKWISGLYQDIHSAIFNQNIKALPKRYAFVLWKSIAAVAAVLIAFFVIYIEWPNKNFDIRDKALVSLSVPLHQKKYVKLPDGSEIWINAGSSFNYPKTFNKKVREVYLSGEAYFDVQHDNTRPFIIHTGKMVTTVLGTAFNIKENKKQQTVVVTVTRGKVSVANGRQVLGIITPNQQISLNLKDDNFSRQNVNAQEVVLWKGNNDLRFDDLTVGEAVTKLEKQFNVRIIFSNERIKNCRFTGTALSGERLTDILKVICTLNNDTYKIQPDQSILITGQGCEN